MALALMVAWTGLVGLVGLRDLIEAEGLGSRLTGGALATAAVVVAIAFARERDRPVDTVLTRVASALVLAIALVVGARLLSGFALQPRLLAVAVTVAVVGLIAVTVVISEWQALLRPPSSPDDTPRSPTGRGALLSAGATVVAALIALPLSWYSTQYLPSNAQSVVSIEAELGDAQRQKDSSGKDLIAVTAKMKVWNTGDVAVRIIFSQYVIVGSPITLAKARGEAQVTERLDRTILGGDDAAARYGGFADYGAIRLIQFGRILWDQTTIEPDEETTMTVLAVYPPKTFDVVRLGVDLVYARADRVPVGPGEYADSAQPDSPEWRRMGGTCGEQYGRVLLTRWPITSSSLLEWLTESDKEVITGRYVGISDTGDYWWPSRPGFDFQIQKRGDVCRNLDPGQDHSSTAEGNRGLERRSKLGQSGTLAEISSPG